MELRQVTVEDLSGMYAIMDPIHKVLYKNKPFEEIKDLFKSKILAPGVTSLLGWQGSQMVGYIIFTAYELRYEKKKGFPRMLDYQGKTLDLCTFAYNLGFGVAPTVRGGGYGLALVLGANGMAHHMGFKGMVADIDADNAPSRRVHEKAGFAEVLRIPDSVRKSGMNTVWIKEF